ncbi:MAG: exodeoxyribonuclease VII small subunit [Bacteroidota bacterium]
MTKEKLTYESALQELEEIVANMQQQTVSIDELETQSKRAAELVAFCQNKLRNVEQNLSEVFDLEF